MVKSLAHGVVGALALMGDSENAQQPPSKKRGALKELSRDNPGLDDDQDSTALESGTFKTASEEALATRRIVRGVGCKSGTVITEEAKDDNGNSNTDKGSADKSEAVDGGETAEDGTKTTIETQKAKDDEGSDCGVDKDSAGDQTEKEGTDNSGAFTSFEQHSTGKNAFTGFASTGFFSFGSGSLTEQPSSSVFGTESAGTTTIFPSKEEVSVETGEENERAAFTAADSVLFEYLEGGWKERGKGEVKLNVSTTDSRKARLLMRSKGNYRLILNASLYPEMKLASMDKKSITFACVNSVRESKSGLSTFALKFKDPAIVEKFREVIEEHKKSKPVSVKAAAATPENSPEG
ncbi:hypothetical protein DY000_02004340 [Brassica cretica]|uniref:RanBD1 domain-containing protein n=1 Tax=Brassica cretica TaxID=69181 RepID=A0ABQ7BYX2_BRACR|nr:hypothetical protein DY000_02004340 [Brassica cretica]